MCLVARGLYVWKVPLRSVALARQKLSPRSCDDHVLGVGVR